MTTWVVLPEANEAAFRALYDAAGVPGYGRPGDPDEVVGNLAHGKDGKLMTGSTRITPAIVDVINLAKPPWLEIHSVFPPASAWEAQELP